MSKDENLQDELKKIDNFFDNLTVEELEEKLEDSGILELQEDEKRNYEIMKNLKKYFLSNIENGYSKFVYNDLRT